MKVVILILALFAASAFAEWIDFGIDGSAATLQVIESTPQGMVLEVTLPGVEIIEQWENGTAYSILNIPGTTPAAVAEGYPSTPTLSFLAAVPVSGSVTMTVLENETVDLGYHTVYPMQPIPFDNSYEAIPFTVEPAAYVAGTYPAEQTACILDGTLRGVPLGRMAISPFSWNALTGKLTASRRIVVSVEYNGTVTIDQRLNSRFWPPVFNQVLVNSDILPEPTMTLVTSGSEPVKAITRRQLDAIDAADLLVIAGDDFVDSMMDNFIDIKMEQGYLTVIVAAGSWGSDSIKSFIQDAYDNWTVPPSFVLLVGDQEDLPAYNNDTDNRYFCMDGSGDYIADIFHGRFVTGTDTYEMVEAKSLKWQFDPLMDADFWGNVLCAGYLQCTSSSSTVAQRWFCFTCETVRDTYMNIYGKTVQREYTKNTSASPPYYYRSDLPSAGQQVPLDITWDGDAAGILASINDGVFLVQHRDHGGQSGWGDPYFNTSHFGSLANGERTPVVFSINCLTGQFMWTGGECFAEQFICRENGAVAVVAAVDISYSYFNDYVCYGMYYSFNDQFTSPPFSYTSPSQGYLGGQTLMNGMLEMQAAAPFNPYGPWQGYAETEWDLFHFFGDPTMDLRTEVPCDLTVLGPPTLSVGATTAQFIVSDPSDGPVELALVCLRKPDEDIWVSGLTNASGVVNLTFPAITSTTEMPWMVTAHNAYPEWGAINGVGIGETVTAGITTIGQPFPNPSSSAVFFPVSLEAAGNVSLTVYDLSGRAVSVVQNGELEAGSHQLVWNGRSGEDAAPMGIYVARLVSPGGVSIAKIVLSR